MQQAKFTLTHGLLEFLSNYGVYGFKDKSDMVRAALLRLQHDLELQELRQSANLYAELYEEDDELRGLTELAIKDWPE
jgi:hypothetical protein